MEPQIQTQDAGFPIEFSGDATLDVKSVFEALKLHKHLGYDNSQILPTASLPSYGGRVTSTAGGILPTGWTVSVNATTHVYTVTHNLGTTNYSLIAFAYGAALPLIFLTYNSNTFTAEFDNSSGTAFATDWNFILRVIS